MLSWGLYLDWCVCVSITQQGSGVLSWGQWQAKVHGPLTFPMSPGFLQEKEVGVRRGKAVSSPHCLGPSSSPGYTCLSSGWQRREPLRADGVHAPDLRHSVLASFWKMLWEGGVLHSLQPFLNFYPLPGKLFLLSNHIPAAAL